MTTATTLPGWHFVLADGTTYKTNQWVQDTSTGASQETWSGDHMAVTTQYMGSTVTGDVQINDTFISPNVMVNVDGTLQTIKAPRQIPVKEMQYTDQNGNLVTSYSIDGQTWLSSDQYRAGLPSIYLNGVYRIDKNTGTLIDQATGKTVGTADVNGNYTLDGTLTYKWDPSLNTQGYQAHYSPDGTSLDTQTGPVSAPESALQPGQSWTPPTPPGPTSPYATSPYAPAKAPTNALQPGQTYSGPSDYTGTGSPYATKPFVPELAPSVAPQPGQSWNAPPTLQPVTTVLPGTATSKSAGAIRSDIALKPAPLTITPVSAPTNAPQPGQTFTPRLITPPPPAPPAPKAPSPTNAPQPGQSWTPPTAPPAPPTRPNAGGNSSRGY
jgi:hypothetical protein